MEDDQAQGLKASKSGSFDASYLLHDAVVNHNNGVFSTQFPPAGVRILLQHKHPSCWRKPFQKSNTKHNFWHCMELLAEWTRTHFYSKPQGIVNVTIYCLLHYFSTLTASWGFACFTVQGTAQISPWIMLVHCSYLGPISLLFWFRMFRGYLTELWPNLTRMCICMVRC